jgi:hypothetical protein
MMFIGRADRHRDIRVRPVRGSDARAWLRMRRALWPEGSAREHRGEIDRYFAGHRHEPKAALIAIDDAGSPAAATPRAGKKDRR